MFPIKVVELLLIIACVSDMMQPFEFSNNALSLIFSIFSLIVGMAYPLLLQAIQRIDEQYRSSKIAKMLRAEPQFKQFQWLVVISVAFAFSSIFVMQLIDGHDCLVIVWITAHALVSLFLLITTISLFYLILTYYHADDLLDHINSNLNHGRR